LSEVPGVEPVLGDVRDAALMRKLIQGHEYVFHLAALIDVAYSYNAPRSYIETNVCGTLNVLDAARDAEAKVIHTSSSEVYGTAQYTPQDEEHPINPQSPYAASKTAADAIVRSFHLSYGLPCVILRPFNTYGPRQSQRAVVAHICRQALNGSEIVLGNLEPKRDLMFVRDTAQAFLAAMHLPFGVYNAGTGESVKIGALPSYVTSKRVVSQLDKFRPEASEVDELCCDATKLRETGWSPKVSLLYGMKKTYEWHDSRR
jgi:nucleoside-diphosphate-sugar epimerase